MLNKYMSFEKFAYSLKFTKVAEAKLIGMWKVGVYKTWALASSVLNSGCVSLLRLNITQLSNVYPSKTNIPIPKFTMYTFTDQISLSNALNSNLIVLNRG